MTPRTHKPDPRDRKLVTALVDELGVAATAERLGVSRVALLGVLSGRGCYSCTLQRVSAALATLV
jgi:hypothetical protein